MRFTAVKRIVNDERGLAIWNSRCKYSDVASVVGDNFKNVRVLSIKSSLFHLFRYTFLQTKHHTKDY